MKRLLATYLAENDVGPTTQRFYEIGFTLATDLEREGVDPNMVADAMVYLTFAPPEPGEKRDIEWLATMLTMHVCVCRRVWLKKPNLPDGYEYKHIEVYDDGYAGDCASGWYRYLVIIKKATKEASETEICRFPFGWRAADSGPMPWEPAGFWNVEAEEHLQKLRKRGVL